jgi:hypothetical protein
MGGSKGKSGLDASGPGNEPVTGSCEHGNGHKKYEEVQSFTFLSCKLTHWTEDIDWKVARFNYVGQLGEP